MTIIKNRNKFLEFIRKNIVFIFVYFLCVCFVLWKCKYGFGKKDEALYLTTSYRLIQGNSLFFDEQHRSQLYSFILYPIMKSYVMLTNNKLDGILLDFRYIYVFFQLITSVFIYLKLKKYSKFGAYVSSLVFLLYSPYNLMALSYNTICYETLTVSLLMLLDGNTKSYFVSGIFFSLAVLCCPYLAIIYIIWMISVYICKVIKKDLEYLNTKTWLSFTLGVILMAIIFIAFCLSKTSLSNILYSLPDIINDPEYPSIGFFQNIKNLIYTLVAFTGDYSFFVIYLLFGISIIVYFLDKNRNKHIDYYLIVGIFIDVIAIIIVFSFNKLVNYVLYPLNILGIYITIIFWSKENKKIFFIYFLPAISYCIINFFSSDCEMMAISSSSIVCLMMSIVMITKLINNNYLRKLSKLSICALLCSFVFLLSAERYIWVFGNVYIKNNDTYIDEGPYKGIFSTFSQYEDYTNDIVIVDRIRDYSNNGSIIFLSKDNWMYLMANNYKNAGPSTWKTSYSYYIDSINRYYTCHDIPDIIYIDKNDFSNYKELTILHNYSIVFESEKDVIFIMTNS